MLGMLYSTEMKEWKKWYKQMACFINIRGGGSTLKLGRQTSRHMTNVPKTSSHLLACAKFNTVGFDCITGVHYAFSADLLCTTEQKQLRHYNIKKKTKREMLFLT